MKSFISKYSYLIDMFGMFLIKIMSPLVFILLVISKLAPIIDINWFGDLMTLSAIGTPLWILFIGIVCLLLDILLLFLISTPHNTE